MRSFIHKLIWLFQRRRREAELREELEFHLEEEAAERKEEGITSDEANWAAHRDLGNVTLIQENVRRVWLWVFLEQLVQDIRYALRMMRKNPFFTVLATFSLALGIGANTAIYSFVDSIFLRTLPVPDPASLVVLQWHSKDIEQVKGEQGYSHVMHSMSGSADSDPELGLVAPIFPFPAFELVRKNDSLFSSVFAYRPARAPNVVIHGQADIAKGEYVSGGYFSGLAVSPAAGRLIIDDDDRLTTPPVAVVSFGLSQKYFGGPGNAVGQKIVINNIPVTVVGVTPPEFFGVDPAAAPDFYLPMHANVALEVADPYGTRPDRYFAQNEYWIEMMARLRPGISLQQAQAQLSPQFHRWVESTASNNLERANLPVLLLQEGAGGLESLRRAYSKPLYILMILVGVILAIACANIANLLLARATARRGEMALRLSLGAGRSRLMRQLLTESILLASLGGGMGVCIAFWSIRLLTLLLANGKAGFTLHASLNWHVLGMAAVLSFLTGILFGLAPALQSASPDTVPALKTIQVKNPHSRTLFSLNHMLVVVQIALSLLMLVAAGLFVKTLSNLHSVEMGFNQENILLFSLNALRAGHKEPEIVSFYKDLQERFRAIPGVRSTGLSNYPLIGWGHWATDVRVSRKLTPNTVFLTVGPEFFTTMQIPVLSGRSISERDQPGSPAVAVVSELFARINFGDENPIGRHLTFGDGTAGRIPKRDMEIVGIVKNARYGDLRHDTPPVVYVAYNQRALPVDEMTYALRTAGDPLSYVNTVRQIVHQADSRVPVSDVRTQDTDIGETIGQETTFAKLCTAFAMLALIIACVGLYGTVSYNVARRTSEIGIRMALGAQRGAVVWIVLREVSLLAVLGLAVSVPIAFATTRFLKSFLFEMKSNDPLTLSFAIVTLLISAIIAGYLPARKASRIDPMIALRHE